MVHPYLVGQKVLVRQRPCERFPARTLRRGSVSRSGQLETSRNVVAMKVDDLGVVSHGISARWLGALRERTLFARARSGCGACCETSNS